MVFNLNVWKEYAKEGRQLEKNGIYVRYFDTSARWSKQLNSIASSDVMN